MLSAVLQALAQIARENGDVPVVLAKEYDGSSGAITFDGLGLAVMRIRGPDGSEEAAVVVHGSRSGVAEAAEGRDAQEVSGEA